VKLPRLLNRRGLVCQQAVELITDYIEGALPAGDRRRLEAHLAECPPCREYLAQISKTIELTGAAGTEHLSPQAQDDLIAIYRQWRAEGGDGPGSQRPV
jgi:predicted anti-sigma-YlaC factor YlaD